MRVGFGLVACTLRQRGVVFLLVSALWLGIASSAAQAQTIQFRQVNYATPQTPQTTVAVTYTAAQTAGGLNVVVVGWNDSAASIVSVADTRGNTYSPAAAPTVMSGKASQAIYYAPNIFAASPGANIVTVTFSTAADYPDIRIAEYSGLDPVNPLVAGVGAFGTSATSNSGSLTTTAPNTLLVAGNVVQTATTGAGSGFTQRVITSPDGDILEDRIATTAGTYSATAPLSSGYWVMQMVAFRPPSADTTPPSISLTAPVAAPPSPGR